MPIEREGQLRQARGYAEQVIRHHKPGFSLSDDLLMRLSQVAVDALDSCQKAQPFHSQTLDVLSVDLVDCVESDSEFKLAKFAFAFTTLMKELNGSIIGSTTVAPEAHGLQNELQSARGRPRKRRATSPTAQPPPEKLPAPVTDFFDEDKVKLEPEDMDEVEIKQEIPDEAVEPTTHNALQQFLQQLQDGPVKGEVEEPNEIEEGGLVPTVSTQRVKCDCEVCSSQDTQVARAEWLKDEMNTLLGRSKRKPGTYKKPRCLNEPPKPVPPPRPTGKCVCGQSVSVEFLDKHVENFHRELWMQEANACSVPECDFRSMIANVRQKHVKLVHGQNSSFESYYKLKLDVKCPYCPETVASIADYMRHAQLHPSMCCSRAPIYICNSCNFSTHRMYLMIQHWCERRASRFGLKYKCEPKLVFDYVAARSEMKNSWTLAQAFAAAEEEEVSGSSRRVAVPRNSLVRRIGRGNARPTPLLREDQVYNVRQ